MGDSGGSLTSRSTTGLRGLMDAAGFDDVDEAEALADGWQVSDFGEARPRSLGDLVRRTGAPAVMVTFLDSDIGFVEAVTPGGGTWEGLLNRTTADSYEIPLERFPVEPAVAGALAWSTAAGLKGDEELIRKALTGTALFASELSALLSAALGIPGAQLPEPDDDEDDDGA
ncbi:hypothetical protein ACWEF9_13575 [Streptomyces sp. NPDC004980]